MTSNHAQVIQTLARDLLGISTTVQQLQAGFGRLGMAIAGAFSIVAAEKLLAIMGKIVEKGSELEHQIALLRTAGATADEAMTARAKAFEISAKVQTTTLAENVKHINELRYAFGDINKAQAALESVSKVEAVLGAVGGAKDQVWPLVKSLETRGETLDPAEFSSYLNIMARVGIASGGRITPQQFYQTFKYGRTAGLQWDETFVGGALPRLIQELGGSGTGGGGGGPGNALMSAYRAVIGGTLSQQSGRLFQDLGLLPGGEVGLSGPSHLRLSTQPHGVRHTPTGHLTHFDPGSMQGAALFRANPYEWVQQVLGPAMARRFGFTPGGEIAPEQNEKILDYMAQLFQNRTAGQVMTMMLTQGRFMMGERSPFEKDIRLQGGAMGYEEAYKFLMETDPTIRMQAFKAQWESLLQALGAPLVSAAIPLMRELTDAITRMVGSVGQHPEVVKVIAVGITALAVALGVTGIALVIAAIGPTGWIAAGITVLVGAITLIDWKSYWDGFITGIKNLVDAFKVLWGFPTGPAAAEQYGPPAPPGIWDRGGGRTTWGPGGRMISPTAPVAPADHPVSPSGALEGGATGHAVASGLIGARPGGFGGFRPPIGAERMTGNANVPPSSVLEQAQQVALQGGPGAVYNFMAKEGYPKSGNWCGEFTAAVVKAAGGTPPAGAAVASNWRNWGTVVQRPQPGDIAIRRGTPTGQTGSHVTIVESYDPHSNTFIGLGGNQHRWESRFPVQQYDFRRPGPPPASSKTPTIENHVFLDGEKISHSTMNQMIAGFNSSRGGSGIPDFTSIRPQAV